MPFSITPDTEFLFDGSHHRAALNTLLFALESGEGFVKITGEVGTGKTLLCRRVLRSLGEGWVSAYLPHPAMDTNSLFNGLARELNIDLSCASSHFEQLQVLNAALVNYADENQKVVVCIDEAQAMPISVLESLRLLSNLETEKRKLLHIVLFGQPELDTHLRQPEIRQLLQRITFHYQLAGLQKSETIDYVAYRLRVAGATRESLFSRAALSALHRLSRGTPRLVNILANKALLAAYGEGDASVRAKHVRRAGLDTEGVRDVSWLGWLI